MSTIVPERWSNYMGLAARGRAIAIVMTVLLLAAAPAARADAPTPELAWSTFLGEGEASVSAVVTLCDSAGNLYVVINTARTDYPVKGASSDNAHGGGDVYIARISADGQLLWGTYLGGSANDAIVNTTHWWDEPVMSRERGAHVDGEGNLLLAGYTRSTDFPTPNGSDTRLGGATGHFAAKITPEGAVAWASCFGSYGSDLLRTVVDSASGLYVLGKTTAPGVALSGGFDTTFNGPEDVFLIKFVPSGQMEWGTYIGNGAYVSGDHVPELLADSSGGLYYAGPAFDSAYPAFGAFDSSFTGLSDVYVAKIASDGQLTWGAYLGGGVDARRSEDRLEGVCVDSSDCLLVFGCTAASDFPVQNAFQQTIGDTLTGAERGDAFVAKITPEGELAWASYLGGQGWDTPYAGAVDPSGNLFVTGVTVSPDFPTPNGFDTDFDPTASHDCRFVAKVTSSGQLAWSSFLGTDALYPQMPPAIIGVVAGQGGDFFVTMPADQNEYPTPNGFDTTRAEFSGYAARITADGQLAWGTYLRTAGGFADWGRTCSGQAGASNSYILTFGTGWPEFPVPGGFDTSFGSGVEPLIAIMPPEGGLAWATFLGGTDHDCPDGSLLDPSGNLIVWGRTCSSDFPAQGGFDTTFGGPYNVFIAKIRMTGEDFVCSPPGDNGTVDVIARPEFDFTVAEGITDVRIEFSSSSDFAADDGALGFAIASGSGTWQPTSEQWRHIRMLASADGEIYWRLAGTAGSDPVSGPAGTLTLDSGSISGLSVDSSHTTADGESVWPGRSGRPAFLWTDETRNMSVFYVDVSTDESFPLGRPGKTVTFGGKATTHSPYRLNAGQWLRVRKLATRGGGRLYWRVRARSADRSVTVASDAQTLTVDGGFWTLGDVDLWAAAPSVTWSHAGEGITRCRLEFSSDPSFPSRRGVTVRLPASRVTETACALRTGDLKVLKALARRAGVSELHYRMRGADADKAFVTYSAVKTCAAP